MGVVPPEKRGPRIAAQSPPDRQKFRALVPWTAPARNAKIAALQQNHKSGAQETRRGEKGDCRLSQLQ